MNFYTKKNIKNKFIDFSSILIFCFLIFYFTYAGLKGEHGLFKNLESVAEISSLRSELEIIKSKKMELESKVVRFGNSSLDLELLDEQSRKTLGMARADEIILE